MTRGRLVHEAAQLRLVGEWIGRAVLDEIGSLLASPQTIELVVPAEAAVLLDRPLELAVVGGKSLAAHGAVFVRRIDGQPSPAAPAPTATVRILAAFSLPVDADALALRSERLHVERLVAGLRGQGRSVELTVLQYSVTKRALADALADPRGYQIVHLAGHGNAGTVSLETSAGGIDHVDGPALATLLSPVRDLRLVVLSSCESASGLVAGELAVRAPGDPSPPTASSNELPSIARTVLDRVGCAVLAMRYPVGDSFGIAFARTFYSELLGHGRTLPVACAAGVRDARPEVDGTTLADVTPTLLGATAATLRLPAPEGRPAEMPEPPSVGPARAETFVGRGVELARALAVLRLGGRVLFCGPPGSGRTSCLAEVLHVLPPDPGLAGPRRFVDALDRLEDEDLRDGPPLLAARFLPDELPDGLPDDVTVVPLGPLDRDESLLLARSASDETAAILRGELDVDDDAWWQVRRWVSACEGDPRLVTTGRPGLPPLDPWLHDADVVLAQMAPVQHHLAEVGRWVEELVERLSHHDAALLAFLCALEPVDRRRDVLPTAWARVWPADDESARRAQLADGLSRLVATGAVGADLRVWPAVAHAVRKLSAGDVAEVVDRAMASYWLELARRGMLDSGSRLDYLVRDAASATGYALRAGDIAAAAVLVHGAFQRGASTPADRVVAVATLEAILARVPRHEALPLVRIGLACVLQLSSLGETETRLVELLGAASGEEAEEIAKFYAMALVKASRYVEADELLRRYLVATGAAPTWSSVNDDVLLLEVLVHVRSGPDIVQRARELMEVLDALPEPPAEEAAITWNIRERLLDAGRRAAKDIGDWDTALAWNALRIESKLRRRAPALEVARSRTNDVAALRGQGRLDEAAALLLETKAVFEEHGADVEVGNSLSTLAAIEAGQGRVGSVEHLETEALRLKYLAPEPIEVAISHSNLGVARLVAGREADGFAHLVAALVLWQQVGSIRLAEGADLVADFMSGYARGGAPVPGGVEELVRTVEAVPGVRFDRLVRALGDPGTALVEALQKVDVRLGPKLARVEASLASFEPLLDLAVLGVRDSQAAMAFDQVVTMLEFFDDSRALGDALRRLLADPPVTADEVVSGVIGGWRLLVVEAVDRCRRQEATRLSMGEALGALDELFDGQVSAVTRQVAAFSRLIILAPQAQAQSGTEARLALEQELGALSMLEQFEQLIPRLRSALEGDRRESLYAGLDAIDRAVLRRLVSALDGRRPWLVRLAD